MFKKLIIVILSILSINFSLNYQDVFTSSELNVEIPKAHLIERTFDKAFKLNHIQ